MIVLGDRGQELIKYDPNEWKFITPLKRVDKVSLASWSSWQEEIMGTIQCASIHEIRALCCHAVLQRLGAGSDSLDAAKQAALMYNQSIQQIGIDELLMDSGYDHMSRARKAWVREIAGEGGYCVDEEIYEVASGISDIRGAHLTENFDHIGQLAAGVVSRNFQLPRLHPVRIIPLFRQKNPRFSLEREDQE